jgi:hypothetical protein
VISMLGRADRLGHLEEGGASLTGQIVATSSEMTRGRLASRPHRSHRRDAAPVAFQVVRSP